MRSNLGCVHGTGKEAATVAFHLHRLEVASGDLSMRDGLVEGKNQVSWCLQMVATTTKLTQHLDYSGCVASATGMTTPYSPFRRNLMVK